MIRKLLLVAAAIAFAIAPSLELEAAPSKPPPSFTVYAATGSEEAGEIPVKVCKHGTLNASASTVTLYTIDGTATAATDYVSKRVVLTFGAGASCQFVPIATRNDALPEATETLTAKLLKGTNARLYRGTAPLSITDTDGHVHPDPEDPPPPPPPPPPGGTWALAPLSNAGGYARAKATCSSIYRSAESDRVGISYPGIAAGTVYKVIENGWGWSPLKSIEGHTGATWTLLALEDPYEPYGRFVTVAEACLEGVKPA